jgi:hypothetical protein
MAFAINLKKMTYTIEYIKALYLHNLELYHLRRNTESSAMHNLIKLNMYGSFLIKEHLLTQEEHELNKLPLVDFKKLFEKSQSQLVLGDDSNSGIDGE